MKHFLLLLCAALLCLSLFGCGSEYTAAAPQNEAEIVTPDTEDSGKIKNPVQVTIDEELLPSGRYVKRIEFERHEEVDESNHTLTEYAEICGYDPKDALTVWKYTSDKYEVAQLPRVSKIGEEYVSERYYFCEDGAVVALHPETGEELWRNPDFGGALAQDSASFIDSGATVYLCGYFGPDFYAVDADGNTLCKIDSLSEGYTCPYAIEKVGNKLAISFEFGPEGAPEGGNNVLYVDLADYSCSSNP